MRERVALCATRSRKRLLISAVPPNSGVVLLSARCKGHELFGQYWGTLLVQWGSGTDNGVTHTGDTQVLIAMAGLPGTGKSSLARQLTTDLSGVVLNKDEIRAALFPPSWIDYSKEQDDLCMSIVLQVASYLLSKNPNQYVILDGCTFSRRYQVLELDRTAEKLNIRLKIIECVCSEETARCRLEYDASERRHQAANRDYALYLSIKAHFEPIPEPRLVVNTDNDFADCVKLCISYIVGEIE